MKKNILVITHWGYEEGLIQSYTLPYLRIIHSISPETKIFLFTQEKNGLDKDKEKIKKINEELKENNIFLLPEKYHRAGAGKYFVSATKLFKHISFIFKKNIGFIHSFCTPAGSYAYLLAKFSGQRLVIDSYEPHAEYMKDSGTWSPKSFAYRLLRSLEKKQAKRADYLITTTSTMKEYTEKRFNIQLKNVFVKPACVDLKKFDFNGSEGYKIRKQLNLENKIVGVYAGKFGDFYLKEECFELFHEMFRLLGDSFHVLLLSDLKKEELEKFCQQYELKISGFTLLLAPHDEVPNYLSTADFAFSLYRPAPSKKYCTPIKDGEYWAIGLPIIITKDISDDSAIIEKNDIGYVLKGLSDKEYENAVIKIKQLLSKDKNVLREKIRKIAIEKRSFGIAEKIYKKIYQ